MSRNDVAPTASILDTAEPPQSAVEASHTGVAERRQRVQIKGLIVKCLIGIHDREQRDPQRVRIDIELTRQEPDQPTNDVYRRVICYEAVIERVRAIATAGHFKLIETLAERIADACQADYPDISALHVRVGKIDVFPDVEMVGVQLERTFDQDTDRNRKTTHFPR